MVKNRLSIPVYSIHPLTASYVSLSIDAYKKLLTELDPTTAVKASFKKQEVVLSNDIDLYEKLRKGLYSKRKISYPYVVIEILDEVPDIATYDEVCSALTVLLSKKPLDSVQGIILVVPALPDLKSSLFLTRILMPLCEKTSKALLVVSSKSETLSEFLCHGKFSSEKIPPIIQLEHIPEADIFPLEISNLSDGFQPLFGHFEINSDGELFHTNIIISVNKIADDKKLVKALQQDITNIIGDNNFILIPFGIPGGGIDILSIRILDADSTRLIHPKDQFPKAKSCVILCDILSQVYPLVETIEKLRNVGVENISLFSITETHPKPDIDIPTKVYIGSSYKTTKKETCNFCLQNIQRIKGEYFDEYARKLKQFDSYTFWELISLDPNYYSVGHWPSDRTPNHYHFRFIARNIFSTHSYGLSIRLRNLLEEHGILPRWVKKIICTAGEESSSLSMALAEALGLSKKDVISIDRKYFSSIAGKEINNSLTKYIEETYGNDAIKRQNVIIVDQAAHHFKTMSSLRDISEYYECTVLAFAVFIDRTEPDFSLGEYLYNSHYINLYSWPVPPRRNFECPCLKEII